MEGGDSVGSMFPRSENVSPNCRLYQRIIMIGALSGNDSLSRSVDPGNRYGQHAPADAGVPPKLVHILAQTQPWVRFMSVLLFIGSGLYIAFGVLVMIMMASRAAPPRSGGGEMIGALIYVAVGLLFLFPAGFLWRYARNIHAFRFSLRIPDLENALEAQKSYWKFVGTLTLVGLVLCVFLVPVMILATTRTHGL